MDTIVAVMLVGRTVLAFALTLAFAIHSPTACRASQMFGHRAQTSHQPCHHDGSRPDASHHSCCDGMTCLSALDTRHDAVTPAPSLASTLAPAPIAYLAPRLPLAEPALVAARTPSPPGSTPLIIELRTLLI